MSHTLAEGHCEIKPEVFSLLYSFQSGRGLQCKLQQGNCINSFTQLVTLHATQRTCQQRIATDAIVA